jgi:hypothetical protein
MKKFFTLCVLFFAFNLAKSQVVLNEFYPEPGSTFQEYFELYNTSTSPIPENLDNYTMVVYYEEPGNKSGFYIFDLPSVTVATKDFFVVSSQIIYSIQGQANITADLNWNALGAGGAITKWEKSGSSYVSVPVSNPLTDLFVKSTGSSSGAYTVFVYKNGIQVNGLVVGSSSNSIPSSVKTMPNLFVDMTGSSPDFTINFSTMADNSVEYVNGTAGTNNGYYRQYDGKCGVWIKSSNAADYTPGSSNGSAANTLGTLTISATISSYAVDPTKALFTYNISAGPLDAFAATADTYLDLGIIGELDANDVLLDSRVIYDANQGNQNVIIPSQYDGVILAVKSSAGCYDRVIPISAMLSTLPVHLISFQGNMNKSNKVTLNWTVADNENTNSFEVERSTNGKDFTTIAIVFASEKIGVENYMFYETYTASDRVMYRLKMIDKNHEADYSKILVFSTKATSTNDIKIIGNPVNDKLTFNYSSSATQTVDVKVFDMSGKMIMRNRMNSLEGNNLISVPLSSTFTKGMYVVEIADGTEIKTAKFIKQ